MLALDSFGVVILSMIERFTRTTASCYNIARHHVSDVAVADDTPSASAMHERITRTIHQVRWGLLPPWRGHGGKRGPMVFGATLEEIANTPFLREARAKRRCVVLADGFFFWRKVRGKRQPYWVHLREPMSGVQDAVGFAGIVATNRDDHVDSFAIVHVAAAPPIAAMIDYIPAILERDAGDPMAFARWLFDAELATCTLDRWRIDAVSTYVNSVEHDDPRCIELLRNPRQGELF